MELLDWIQANRPGRIEAFADRLEVSHENGEHSTLWLNPSQQCPQKLKTLDAIYAKYDGIDLFSSTFKIASILESKCRGGVEITPTLAELNEEFLVLNPASAVPGIPFMVQQGIGIYVLSSEGVIYEWDTESSELSQEYTSILTVLDEWVKAVS